jgi:CRP-like cAMP-binding protein
MSANGTFSKFRDFIQSQGKFPDVTWNLLESILEMHELSKGEHTLTESQVCRFIDFVDTGSFRMYYNKDGNEVTTALYTEGACITDMKSLSQQTPSQLNLITNEKSVVVRLYKDKLIGLYGQSPELQALGRSILESMIVNESAWKEMYTLYDPTERYEFLLRKAPTLVLRFPMQHIASFLGIRRETLSRIRGKVGQ